MIHKLEIQAQQIELTQKLRTYVVRKIGKLDTFAPRASRESIHVEVILRQSKAKDKQAFTASVVLYMPQKTLEASETTINIFAAVDVVQEKLHAQLKKYKELHAGGTKRQLFARALRRREKSSVE